MEEGALKAKIVSVTSYNMDGAFADSILVSFKDAQGVLQYKEFESPLLIAENIRMWRRVVLTVLLGRKVLSNEKPVNSFAEYKKQIYGQEVYVDYDGEEVNAIGKDPKNMFYPEVYGLWGSGEEE